MLKNKYLRLMRLNSITGAFLLIIPGMWSLVLASKGFPSLKNIIIFLVGGIFMRSIGCIINDICDHEFDKKVTRTKTRPIASGEVSIRSAIILAFILLIVPLFLILTTNKLSIIIAIISIIPISIYPLMKRYTYWPQLFLGLIFNLGAILGWTIVKNSIELPPILLYLSCTFWILGFDTIYAFQDINDDLKIGVKSTAIKFQEIPKIFISISYSIFTFLYFISIYLCTHNIIKSFIIMLPFTYLYYIVFSFNPTDHKNCFNKFRANIFFGIIELLVLLLVI